MKNIFIQDDFWIFSQVPVNLLMSIEKPSLSLSGSTTIEKETKLEVKKSPNYKVLLHNDPINTMDYVVITLRQVVPQLSDQDALAIMLEAHNIGIGLVIVCDLEPAEFYSEALNAKGLISTIEKES